MVELCRNSKRLVNVQKCIRTNDIENVGRTSRHQTFFEMMGNFSIGDYFRKEAITMAYELLTSEKWFGIPKELLYVTIYTHDEESFEVWTSLGLDPSHIVRLEGNFWEIGEGPCGPDSEIFYDRGERFDADGTAFTKFKNDEDQDRYVEIWNNVFSQFNAEKGVKRENYKELPHKNIDTGAGLERWHVFSKVSIRTSIPIYSNRLLRKLKIFVARYTMVKWHLKLSLIMLEPLRWHYLTGQYLKIRVAVTF